MNYQLIGAGEPDKSAKVFQIVLISASGPWVVDIGDPFHCCWRADQLLEFNGGQVGFAGRQQHGAGQGWIDFVQLMPGPEGRPAACSAATHSQYSRIRRLSSASGTRCYQRPCSSSNSSTPRSSSSIKAPAAAKHRRALYQNPPDEVRAMDRRDVESQLQTVLANWLSQHPQLESAENSLLEALRKQALLSSKSVEARA